MKSKELKVGLFSALALVLLYFGFDFLKGRDFFERTHNYYAIYKNVDQLTKSSPVFVNGYAVGRVSNIRIIQERHNQVLVELEIDSEIRLGDSTKAILSKDFLGTKSILLDIGPVTVPRKNKDTIQGVLAKGMIDIVTESAEPVASDIQSTIRKLNTVLEHLVNNSQELDSIFRNFRRTPVILNNTLTHSSEKIDELTESLKITSEHLNTSLSELSPTLRNLRVFTDTLKRMKLNQTMAKTQKALEDLSSMVSRLNKGDNTASKLLTEDSLYNNLNKLLVSVDSLARHFDSAPRDFLKPLGKSQKKLEKERGKKP